MCKDMYLFFAGMGRMKDHQRFRGLLRLLILLLLGTNLCQTALKVLLNFICIEEDRVITHSMVNTTAYVCVKKNPTISAYIL